MARYIDADELYKETEKKIKANNERGMAVVDGEFLDLINDAFTEDVAPKSEVEKIFSEIDNWFELYSEREFSFAEEEASKEHLPESEAHDYALDIIKELRQLCVAELKKKYTGEEDGDE